MKNTIVIGSLICSTFLLGACVEQNAQPEGLRRTDASGGPRVVFDLEARPFPEIPFPNDLATRLDPSSPTGRRVNVSLEGGSDAEEKVRGYVNRMSGFGLVSPLWVRFDKPLDLHNLVDRHQEREPDFTNDAIYLVNVDPDSPSYGRFELIDMGLGNYPILHQRPDLFFANDSRAQGTNLLFESVREEDLNKNGKLDPMEDTDDDGVWDVPNLLDPQADPYAEGQTLEFYERETNTLILRPVMPLEPNTTYAVVLTSALIGEDGFAVDSPFEFVNHARQTEALSPLRTLLPAIAPRRFDASLRRVRFAWTFTTQDPTEELVAIRAGLYGEGPLAWLSDEYPAHLELIHNQTHPESETPLSFDPQKVISFLVPLLADQVGPGAGAAIEKSLENIDYVVSGTYLSPYFLADSDGLAAEGVELASGGNAQDDDETFDIDLRTGEARVGEDEVTFICTVPKTIEGVREPPFNTVIYSHAISSTRLEILLFGGSLAKFGFATCTIDAVGHGVAIPRQFQRLVVTATEALDIPNFGQVINHHRARDLNNDGVPDSGGKYFTSDILHSRDNMRQTAIDQMQLIRILRGWDGTKRWPKEIGDSPYIEARRSLVAGWDADLDGESEIAGDFNGDGVVDFGGDTGFVAFGTSLGGIQSAILAGVEPTVRAAASNAGGGILGEIAIRTTISNVRNGVHLRMFGPLLVGTSLGAADGRGRMQLDWILASADQAVRVPFGIIEGVEDTDRIVLRNPNREARPSVPEHARHGQAHVRDGKFRVGVASDAFEASKRQALLGFDTSIDTQGDIMGCAPSEECGDVECPGGHTCSPDGARCIPIAECVWSFDPESLDDPQLARELNLRTVSSDRHLTPTDLGDPLIIEIYAQDGTLKQVIDTFLENTVFENVFYPAGAPLAAMAQGWGLARQTPDFRKFVAVAQMLLEPADPAVWATRYFKNPIPYPYEDPRFREGKTNFFMIGTVGDQTVPISTSIAIARAAGILDARTVDARYGTTPNQFLIDNWVYEGIWWLDRFSQYPGTLFDADDLDEGRFRLDDNPDNADPNPDATRPLRATIATNGDGISALRLPYLNVRGEHTFNAPRPSTAFDITSYMTNQVGWYLAHSGKELPSDPCLEDLAMEACDFVDIKGFSPPNIE